MNVHQLHKLLECGERLTMECKKAQDGLPRSVWETYSAFANTNGGTIVLGVAENSTAQNSSERYTVVGIKDADKMRKDFWNTINNREKVNVNILQDNDIETIHDGDKTVIVIHVPRAQYNQRPVYVNGNMSGGSYRRNHEGDYHCSEQMVRLLVRDSFEDGNDRLFMEHYGMDDIDIPTLEGYRVMFKTVNPEHIWNSLSNKDFLSQLGGYVVNRNDGSEGLTMAGLLMFGKGLPVRERFDNLRMDYIDKSNLIGDQRYSDRLTYDGNWENNLFNFMRLVVPKLTRDLPRPFRMEGLIRDDDTPQRKALREAFTNMIIHADFVQGGLLRVEKYDDRFVLTNPGLLKLQLEQIYKGGESKARNQRMQSMLRMVGLGENIGSGFPMILSAWSQQHWLTPQLTEDVELMQVRLSLHITEAVDGTKEGRKKLTERQRVILASLPADGMITIPELARKSGIAVRTLSREISQLQLSGIIERQGGRKSGRWVVRDI